MEYMKPLLSVLGSAGSVVLGSQRGDAESFPEQTLEDTEVDADFGALGLDD